MCVSLSTNETDVSTPNYRIVWPPSTRCSPMIDSWNFWINLRPLWFQRDSEPDPRQLPLPRSLSLERPSHSRTTLRFSLSHLTMGRLSTYTSRTFASPLFTDSCSSSHQVYTDIRHGKIACLSVRALALGLPNTVLYRTSTANMSKLQRVRVLHSSRNEHQKERRRSTHSDKIALVTYTLSQWVQTDVSHLQNKTVRSTKSLIRRS
jgi:hypothetical protein